MLEILIVEDDVNMASMIAEHLSHQGHRVYTAGDAISGFIVALARKPDLVISDFMLPAVPGKNLFSQLRADPSTQHIPIIVLTAYPAQHVRGYLPREVCPNIISKPVDFDLLDRTIQARTSSGRQEPKNPSA